MSLNNFFELFGLPAQYRIDAQALEAAYRQVQQRVHPDKFVSAPDAERRTAMQWASAANEGYKALRHPVLRARHLLTLHGHDLKAESNTAMPAGFLMQQLEWREALDDARHEGNGARLMALEDDVKEAATSKIDHIARLLDDAHDYAAATVATRELMFIDKFKSDVADAMDALVA
jgi:molecular chaperone HscB